MASAQHEKPHAAAANEPPHRAQSLGRGGGGELDARVLAVAERIAGVPAELLQINKRSVHRAMEIMGIRTGIRAGSELQGLAAKLPAVQALLQGDAVASVKQATGN